MLPAALAAAGVALSVVWRIGGGLRGALGTDAPLWGLTARDLLVGASPLVPPGYPGLVALLHAIGLDLVTAGLVWSFLAAALLPAAAFVVARTLGTSRLVAGLVGVGAMGVPDRVAWSQQLQPDALAALLVLLLGGALSGSRSPRSAWVAALVAGLLPLVREHGTPLALLAVAALLATRPKQNLRPVVGLLGLWWLSPLLVGVVPGLHPLAVPWADRAGGALAAFSETQPESLPFLRELHRGDRSAYLALVAERDRVGQLVWHARRSLRLAWDCWLWIGLALVLGGRHARHDRRVLGLLVPLLAALPALVIWSQRRHVALFVPLALLGVGVSTTRLTAWPRRMVGVVVFGLALAWPGRLPGLLAGHRSEALRADHYRALGDHICEEASPPSFLGGVFQDVGLYCPLPRHDPDGSPADWHTFWVTDRPPPAGPLGRWVAVFRLESEHRRHPGPPAVYRLEPDLVSRPCAGLDPAPGTAYLAVGPARADVPGCASPPR